MFEFYWKPCSQNIFVNFYCVLDLRSLSFKRGLLNICRRQRAWAVHVWTLWHEECEMEDRSTSKLPLLDGCLLIRQLLHLKCSSVECEGPTEQTNILRSTRFTALNAICADFFNRVSQRIRMAIQKPIQSFSIAIVINPTSFMGICHPSKYMSVASARFVSKVVWPQCGGRSLCRPCPKISTIKFLHVLVSVRL